MIFHPGQCVLCSHRNSMMKMIITEIIKSTSMASRMRRSGFLHSDRRLVRYNRSKSIPTILSYKAKNE